MRMDVGHWSWACDVILLKRYDMRQLPSDRRWRAGQNMG